MSDLIPDPNRELDIENHADLIRYLQATERIGAAEVPAVTTLAGGISSKTLLVERASGEAWVLKQSLARLRVPTEWFSDPNRVHCEALALRWLSLLAPTGSVPRFIFEDHQHHVLAMEAVAQPHENWKIRLLRGEIEVRHAQRFGEILGTIHARSQQRLAELAPAFEGCTFFESLRLEPYYRYTANQIPAAAPFYADLIAETVFQRIALVHGDFSPKNVLVHNDALILLDYEVAHIGDPAFDVGFSLTHLLSKAHHLLAQRDLFGQAAGAYWERYVATLGAATWAADLEGRAVRHTLACLLARVAGRSQLEYLSAEEKARQLAVCLALVANPPTTIPHLIAAFVAALE